MIFLHILISSFLTIQLNKDTLLLPIDHGIVKKPTKGFTFHEPLEVTIYPNISTLVRSCSNGRIIYSKKDVNGRYQVMLKNKDLLFIYEVDTVKVKKNQFISKGSIVGKLKANDNQNRLRGDSPLVFIAMKNNKLVDAKRYLIFYSK